MDYTLNYMHASQEALSASPLEPHALCQSLSKELGHLSLVSRKASQTETVWGSGQAGQGRGRPISKKQRKQCVLSKQEYSRIQKKRENTIKKLKMQEDRINELEREISSLRRNCQRCCFCRGEQHTQRMMAMDDSQMIQHEELMRLGLDDRSSRGSVEFEAIDFSRTLADRVEMDDRAWVMIGTMLIIMGSKNMEIDGTINSFKVLNDCVDSVRRQVEKSADRIGLDFYFLKEEMKESSLMEGVSFDPFYSRPERGGLNLEALKVESVDQFDLVYDQRIKFSVNYQSLIASVEALKENCWLSI